MSEDDQPQKMATLREILETLRQTYCGKIGCEYMNIQIPEQKRWLQLRMEPTVLCWWKTPKLASMRSYVLVLASFVTILIGVASRRQTPLISPVVVDRRRPAIGSVCTNRRNRAMK